MSQRLVNNRSYYGNSANSRPDDRHFEVFLHLHDVNDAPSAGAEQVNPWAAGGADSILGQENLSGAGDEHLHGIAPKPRA